MRNNHWIFNELGPQTTQQWTWSCGGGKTYEEIAENGKGKSVNHWSITRSLWHSWPLQIEKDFHPGRISAIFKYLVAIHDNSTAFHQYLAKQGTEEAARKAGVKLRSKHSIVPHVSSNDSFLFPIFTIFFWIVVVVADRCSNWRTTKWTSRIQDRGQLVLECKWQDICMEVQRLTRYILWRTGSSWDCVAFWAFCWVYL